MPGVAGRLGMLTLARGGTGAVRLVRLEAVEASALRTVAGFSTRGLTVTGPAGSAGRGAEGAVTGAVRESGTYPSSVGLIEVSR